MAVPSRAFVGVVVFGLITVLVTLPYTLMVLQGYQPGPTSPYQLVFPQNEDRLGLQVFLVLSSIFSVALLVVSWRSLLHGARRNAEKRRRYAELRKQMREVQAQQGKRPPAP